MNVIWNYNDYNWDERLLTQWILHRNEIITTEMEGYDSIRYAFASSFCVTLYLLYNGV